MSTLLIYLIEGALLGIGTTAVLWLLKKQSYCGMSWNNIWFLIISLWSGVAITSWYMFLTVRIPNWQPPRGPAKVIQITYLIFAIFSSLGSGIGWFIIFRAVVNKQDRESESQDVDE